MRFQHRDGTVVHLGYGTNVLPAEDVDGLLAQVATYGDELTRRLGVPTIGLGMWLPAEAAHRFATDLSEVARLRQALADHGVEIVTLNTFPFADFQGEVVKKRVYEPTWADRSRLEYTLDAANVLAALLPEDAARGSLSTLPLGWHTPWTAEDHAASMANLSELAAGLAQIHQRTGKLIRVAIEPEPGCVVETIEEAASRLSEIDRQYLGICLDLCHLAVGFEDPQAALALLESASLDVVKAQPAAALVIDDPADPNARAALRAYSEDRFMHQVRQRGGQGLLGRDDLPEALAAETALADDSPWRVHFHVPVFADPDAGLRNTRDELRAWLAALLGGPSAKVHHLEVETYTWTVLPGAESLDLAEGLAGELAFIRDCLVELGLKPVIPSS